MLTLFDDRRGFHVRFGAISRHSFRLPLLFFEIPPSYAFDEFSAAQKNETVFGFGRTQPPTSRAVVIRVALTEVSVRCRAASSAVDRKNPAADIFFPLFD